jgi:hypothetical protein
MTVFFGRNFKTIVREEKDPGLRQTRELLRWCTILNNMTLLHGTRGEISFRTPRGFAITGNRARLNRLDPGKIAEVLEYSQQENALYVRGRGEPSEEALLHYVIYRKRPDVNAIFHIHDSTMLNAHSDLGIPLISRNSPDEILATLGKEDAIAIRDNGLLFLGSSLDNAGNLIVQKHTEEFRKRLGRTF